VFVGNNSFSAFAALQHFWSPTVSSALDVSYGQQGANHDWKGGANLVWSPVSGFSAGATVFYTTGTTNPNGVWTGRLSLTRSW
jgi:hypothetical protein